MLVNQWPKHCITQNQRQGYWGEMYVKRLLESEGFIVVMNPDQYGAWDMVKIHPVTGKASSIQVKTLVRYVTRNYFGIKEGAKKQTINNLKSCDELILVVRNPASIEDKLYKGKVLKVKNHKNFTLIHNEYRIPSDSDNFEFLAELTPQELNEVNSFNTNKEPK